MDPLAETEYAWSPYAYVANNPLRWIDPDGMKKGDPDDPYDLPEVVVTPKPLEVGDQVLPKESPLWNIWYTFTGPRQYTPSFTPPPTSSGEQLVYGTFNVGTDGRIKSSKPLITGTPFIPTVTGGNVVNAVKGVGKARVFWSGGPKAKAAAEAFAKSNGQTTLEMTRAGQNLEKLTSTMPWKEAAPLWQRMSSAYAGGVKSGTTIHVFQNATDGVRIGSVWSTIEYPILRAKGVEIIYHSIP